jgi:hypothetical protein
MSDYICFMLPTGDMTLDEAKRTLDLFTTAVEPELEQQESSVWEGTNRDGSDPRADAATTRRWDR